MCKRIIGRGRPMNIGLIPENAEITLKFNYMGEEYWIDVNLHYKTFNKIYTPSIKDRNNPIQGDKLDDLVLIYKTEQGIFEFKDIDIKLVVIEDKFLYEIQSDYEAERHNRREAFRVYVGRETNVTIINRGGGINRVNGMIHDISALGMSVVLYTKIDIGSKLEVIFDITDKTYIKLIGDIVRFEELPNKKYLYGCKFDGRSEALGKILLKRQIEHRNRRLNS